MKLIEMIKLEFKLLLSRKEFFYTFTIMMVLISIGFYQSVLVCMEGT